MNSVKRLAVAGILVAIGVVCSPLAIPVGASKCFPIQHMINILAGVLLGPAYAVGMAFVTSLLRVLFGMGTLLAFPGSMVGALCCGLLYRFTQKLPLAYVGEIVGTSVLGGAGGVSHRGVCYGKRSRFICLRVALFCQYRRRGNHCHSIFGGS